MPAPFVGADRTVDGLERPLDRSARDRDEREDDAAVGKASGYADSDRNYGALICFRAVEAVVNLKRVGFVDLPRPTCGVLSRSRVGKWEPSLQSRGMARSATLASASTGGKPFPNKCIRPIRMGGVPGTSPQLSRQLCANRE